LTQTLKNVTLFLTEEGQGVPYVFTYDGRAIGSLQKLLIPLVVWLGS
jgi:hypothetical protein